MKLKNKIAIVTGSSRGIGKEVAAELVREGARVMLCARSEAELKKAAADIGGSVAYCTVDVSDDTSVKKLVDTTLKKYGKIDILVTCAGIYGPMGEFHTQDIDAWNEAIDINLLGTVRAIHAVIPHMKKNGGSIVALAGAGVPKPFPYFSAYSTSKAGIVQLITGLAQEYTTIRFNAIAPGAVATKLIDEVIPAGPEKVGKEFYEQNKKWKKGEGGAVSPSIAAQFIVRLCENTCTLTGKYLSAVWDTNLEGVSPELYTLQRIDGRNFVKK